MAFSSRTVVLIAAFVVVTVAAFGGTFVYKITRYLKRAARWATGRPADDDGAHGPRSAADELRLPGARESPPAVQIQMIRNWMDAFRGAHVAPQTARIDLALKRLARLDREAVRLKMVTDYEKMLLARVRDELYGQHTALVSASTQTPAMPRPVTPPPPPPPPPVKRRVRFILPPPWRDTISIDSMTPVVNLPPPEPTPIYLVCIKSAFRLFGDFFGNPVLLHKIVTTIARWVTKLFSVNILVDLKKDTTTMEFNVLPFIPRH